MRIIAVDPGYDRVGIAILEKIPNQPGTPRPKEKLIFSECFQTSNKLKLEERIHLVGQEIERLISEHNPSILALETLFFSKNQKTALKVAEARGVIQYQAKRQGLSIYEYSPQEIKIAITSVGNSSKEQIISMIPKLIHIEKTGDLDDEYDAIAVGITHFAHHNTH